MRIVDVLREGENKQNRWLLLIDDKPVAHYPNRPEAVKIKQQLTRKLGPTVKIDIVEIPANKYKFESIHPSNRDNSGWWVSRWVLYVGDESRWNRVAHYRTEEAAAKDGKDYAKKHGGSYKVELEDVPRTKYSEDAKC